MNAKLFSSTTQLSRPRRAQNINFRCSAEEFSAVEKLANYLELSLSDTMRHALTLAIKSTQAAKKAGKEETKSPKAGSAP